MKGELMNKFLDLFYRTKCCFCIPSEVGAIIIAVILFVGNASVAYFHFVSTSGFYVKAVEGLGYVLMIISGICCMFCIVLVVGVLLEYPFLLYLWIWTSIFRVITSLIVFLTINIVVAFEGLSWEYYLLYASIICTYIYGLMFIFHLYNNMINIVPDDVPWVPTQTHIHRLPKITDIYQASLTSLRR